MIRLLHKDSRHSITLAGVLTSTFAQGDQLVVGTCELEIKSISNENYDDTQTAGLLYESLYSTSPDAANAKTIGYSIMKIKPSDETLNFVVDCSHGDGGSVSAK